MKKMKSKRELNKIVYASDASCIEGRVKEVIFPLSPFEIQELVKKEKNITARGGGSGLAGGCVPRNSLVIDLSKMNKIFSVDKEKRIAHVSAGLILDELNEELEKYGLEFPVQPSSHSICTIGGMIACNAAGSRAIKYGKTINWIEEIEVIDGNGNLQKKGKTEMSDFSGMEGITGIIVSTKLKLIKKPRRTASLFKLPDIKRVIDLTKKLKLMSDVSMIEFFDKRTSAFLGLENAYHIIAEFESERGKLKDEGYGEIIKLRDKTYPVLASSGYTIIEDPQLFLGKIKEFIAYLESINIPFFGHLGLGILHPCFKEEQKGKVKDMLNYVKKLHGKVSGEHGIGITKREFLDETEKKLILRIKERHDPLYKINIGNMFEVKDEKDEASQYL